MNITERVERLKSMMKEAKLSRPSELFPKLEGPNKPPVLTSSSQPKVKVDQLDVATLPKMRKNGRKPPFTSEMKTQSPYHKQ